MKTVLVLRIIRFLLSLCCVASAAEENWDISASGQKVSFTTCQPVGTKGGTGVLVLVPGYNGNGERMMDARWRAFAGRNGLILLAPTFKAKGHENNEGRGYYYPEQGSGKVMEAAIAEAGKRYGVRNDKVLMFGFSAGAHFAHRFAIWKPERVGAFVAYSAGWWSDPDQGVKAVPGLIMCGEDDPRYGASYGFFKKGQDLGCPWVWKSFEGTGHVLTDPVREMAEVFLEHYAAGLFGKMGKQAGEVIYGDVQSFQTTGVKEEVGEEVRIVLPSREVAEVWNEVPSDQ